MSLSWLENPYQSRSAQKTPDFILIPARQGLVRGLLASNALPVTKWEPWRNHGETAI